MISNWEWAQIGFRVWLGLSLDSTQIELGVQVHSEFALGFTSTWTGLGLSLDPTWITRTTWTLLRMGLDSTHSSCNQLRFYSDRWLSVNCWVDCGVSGSTQVRWIIVEVAALVLTSREDPLGAGIILSSEVQKDMMLHVQSINLMKKCSPVGMTIGISTFWVFQCSSDPSSTSSKQRWMGDIFFIGTDKQDTKSESIKQWDEPDVYKSRGHCGAWNSR